MPAVTRQTGGGKKEEAFNKSVLDRIVDVGVGTKLDRFLIYGASGSGKTRLACTWPKPLLLIGAEDGRDSVKNVKGVQFVRLSSPDEMRTIIEEARKGRWKSLVLDTATSFHGMVVAGLMGLDEMPVQNSFGGVSQDTYREAAFQTKDHLRCLLRLAEHRVANVVILAQEKVFKGRDEGNLELVNPTIMADLSDSVVKFLNAESDCIVHTEVQSKFKITYEEIDGERLELREPMKGVNYCVRTEAHPTYLVKFRVPVGVTTPEYVVNASYDRLHGLLDGKQAPPKE